MINIEAIYHGLERAHFFYGVPHMFHDVIHWAMNGVTVYQAGRVGIRLKATAMLIKRLRKYLKKCLCIF